MGENRQAQVFRLITGCWRFLALGQKNPPHPDKHNGADYSFYREYEPFRLEVQNFHFLWCVREWLEAFLRHHTTIFDPDTSYAWNVNPRFNGEAHSFN